MWFARPAATIHTVPEGSMATLHLSGTFGSDTRMSRMYWETVREPSLPAV